MDKSDRKRRKQRLLKQIRIKMNIERRRRNQDWIDWDLEAIEDIDEGLWIRAETFTPSRIFDIGTNFPDGPPKYLASPRGAWAYSNTACDHSAPNFDGGARFHFSGRVIIPCLTDLRLDSNGDSFPPDVPEGKRFRDGATWMSSTPAEMLTQRSGIRMATGKVLIGGLGLGWFLEEVCKKDEVEEVVLVERSQELLDWYGYRLCQAQPKVKDVICNDVYAVVDRFPDHQYLLDIWPVFHGEFGAVGDRRLADLRRRAPGRVWAWGMD